MSSNNTEVHSYVVRIYIMGEVVEETEFDNVKDARDKYFFTSDLTSCYTQLIYDGKKLSIPETRKILDPDGTYLKKLRHYRLVSCMNKQLYRAMNDYNFHN